MHQCSHCSECCSVICNSKMTHKYVFMRKKTQKYILGEIAQRNVYMHKKRCVSWKRGMYISPQKSFKNNYVANVEMERG